MARSRFSRDGLHHLISDAIDTATEALYKAAEKYDSSRGPFDRWANAFISKRLYWLSLRGASAQTDRQELQEPTDNTKETELPTEMLYALTDGQRFVVSEKIQSQRTFHEIGEILGVTRQAAHRRYKRALRRLRKDRRQPSLF